MSSRFHDPYGRDVLTSPVQPPRRKRPTTVPVAAELGLVVEDVSTGWCGAITRVETVGGQTVVDIEDRNGRSKSFPLGPGFWIDGKPVELTKPTRPQAPSAPTRTNSGSRVVADVSARVARSSRLWVEGIHDAELVEKIWGHDLRVEGVVVEPLGGIDHLPERISDFAPSPGRRLGVLVDHLVQGSKESRLAQTAVAKLPGAAHVLIVGHPYVDVWQAVKPQVLGMDVWPVIDRSVEWKRGVLQHLGWPSDSVTDVALGWKRILSHVTSFRDLEPAFLGRVEELIDHVTTDPADQ